MRGPTTRRLRRTDTLVFVALFLVLGSALPARAGYVSAVNFTNGTIEPTGTYVSAGFSFTTNQTVTIDALADFSPLATGSDVRLDNSAGTTLATATVLSSDPSDGTFEFHSITPIILSSRTTCYIAADIVVGQLAEYSVKGLTPTSP